MCHNAEDMVKSRIAQGYAQNKFYVDFIREKPEKPDPVMAQIAP